MAKKALEDLFSEPPRCDAGLCSIAGCTAPAEGGCPGCGAPLCDGHGSAGACPCDDEEEAA